MNFGGKGPGGATWLGGLENQKWGRRVACVCGPNADSGVVGSERRAGSGWAGSGAACAASVTGVATSRAPGVQGELDGVGAAWIGIGVHGPKVVDVGVPGVPIVLTTPVLELVCRPLSGARSLTLPLTVAEQAHKKP